MHVKCTIKDMKNLYAGDPAQALDNTITVMGIRGTDCHIARDAIAFHTDNINGSDQPIGFADC